MSKTKRLTLRLDNDLHRDIMAKCRSLDCSKSELVEAFLRAGLEDDDSESQAAESKTIPKGRIVRIEDGQKPIPMGRFLPDEEAAATKSEPYDIYNSTSGCFSRYRGNGELMFHFMPIEKVNGTQYYRDTMGDNPKRKWYKSVRGEWIQTIPL